MPEILNYIRITAITVVNNEIIPGYFSRKLVQSFVKLIFHLFIFSGSANVLFVSRLWQVLQNVWLSKSTHQAVAQRSKFVNRFTGRARLIRSHSSARFCFELSGNSN